jgi:hypothetical protein
VKVGARKHERRRHSHSHDVPPGFVDQFGALGHVLAPLADFAVVFSLIWISSSNSTLSLPGRRRRSCVKHVFANDAQQPRTPIHTAESVEMPDRP